MFSVPESIEIRAPADRANHSTGTRMRSARSMAAMTRAHSGSATEPSALVGSPQQHHPGHALGVALRRRGDHADDDPRPCCRPRPVDRHERRPSSSRSCSTNVPSGPASSATSSYGYTMPRRRGTQHLLPRSRRAAGSARWAAGHATRYPGAGVVGDGTATSRVAPVSGSRRPAEDSTSSTPAPSWWAPPGCHRTQLLGGQLDRRPHVIRHGWCRGASSRAAALLRTDASRQAASVPSRRATRPGGPGNPAAA